MSAAAIPSLWYPIIQVLTEVVAHAGKLVAGKRIDAVLPSHIVTPQPLIDLRAHCVALKAATDHLVKETLLGVLSESYHQTREAWVTAYAPWHTVLHNLDPMLMNALDIYSPNLATLLRNPLFISAESLADALEQERMEIIYDTEAHLCTLCLQIVRRWSESKTIIGGLQELSAALADTVASLESFIKSTWSLKELA